MNKELVRRVDTPDPSLVGVAAGNTISNTPKLVEGILYWSAIQEDDEGRFDSATYYSESGSIDLSRAIVVVIGDKKTNKKSSSKYRRGLYELGWIKSEEGRLDIVAAYKSYKASKGS